MPAPRRAVTRTRVIAEAAKIADEVGLDHLTLAAVAARLGISVPGIYKHVGSIDAIRREMAILGLEELIDRISIATVGKSNADALRGAARAYRDYAKDHPGRYAASVIAPPADDERHTANSDRLLQIMFAILGGFDLTRHDAIDAIRSFRAITHGFVSLELAGGFGLPQSVDASFERLVDTFIRGLAFWHEPG